MRPIPSVIAALTLAVCILHSATTSIHASSSDNSPRGSPRNLFEERGKRKAMFLNKSGELKKSLEEYKEQPSGTDLHPHATPQDASSQERKKGSPKIQMFSASRQSGSPSPSLTEKSVHVDSPEPSSIKRWDSAKDKGKEMERDDKGKERDDKGKEKERDDKGKGKERDDKGKEKERDDKGKGKYKDDQDKVIKSLSAPIVHATSWPIFLGRIFDAFAELSRRLHQLKTQGETEVDESMVEDELKALDVAMPVNCERTALGLEMRFASSLNYVCYGPVEREKLKKEFDDFRGVNTPSINHRGIITAKIDALKKEGVKAEIGPTIAKITASTTEYHIDNMVRRGRVISQEDIVRGSAGAQMEYAFVFNWFAGVTVWMSIRFGAE